jgi:hypothetical protein
MSNSNQEQHKYYEGEDDHGSKRDSRVYATDQCTGPLSREGGGECATGRAATSCNTKSSSARLPEAPSSGVGWTYQGTRLCSMTASGRA